ncbi:MAG: hypothetical protein GVY17_10580 [Cyanobacteria bacterium]|jgi:uncharacterized protein YjbI with pentapeptide repeats|nr:hypothetical protein [Cyanobacteria bacterium GSL.Bin21]
MSESTQSSSSVTPNPLVNNFALKRWGLVSAIALLILGWFWNTPWLLIPGMVGAFFLSWSIVRIRLQFLYDKLKPVPWLVWLAWCGWLIACLTGLKLLGVGRWINQELTAIKWDEFGSWGEWFGALGQILIAMIAVYVAWRQYVISRDLTIQQNLITQQQTIDTYFQGICELALGDDGFLEDWPQERAFAEGRTAAILKSVDGQGKAKIIRFLSQSRLLTPLKRDRHLGRPILDGQGGYAEDRAYGIRVIDLGVMLAGTDLSGTDLRWSDLSEANLVQSQFRDCELYGANLSRSIFYEASFVNADLRNTRLFYGSVETATPRRRGQSGNYETGEGTGAVVEKADFSGVQGLSENQRYYCCAWCGEAARKNIPGGCEGIPNLLGR